MARVSAEEGSRRYRRRGHRSTTRFAGGARAGGRGPNWLLGIACVLVTVMLSVLAGDILGNIILSSGGMFKKDPPAGLVAPPASVGHAEGEGALTASDSTERKPVHPPPLLLPPSAEESEARHETEDGTSLKHEPSSADQPASVSARSAEEGRSAAAQRGPYQVQAGLFLKEENARAQVDRLEEEGVRAQVTRVAKNGAYFYRVQVGGFGDRQAAYQKAQELGRKGYSTFVIGE